MRELFSDDLLQRKLRLVCHDLTDLHKEYADDLKTFSGGQDATATWSAQRSAFSWFGTVRAMCRRLTSEDVIAKLNMQPKTLPGGLPVSTDSPAVQDEIRLMQLHADFLLDLRANRSWSQAFYGMCFPFAVAQVFCESEPERDAASRTMRRMADGLLALEDYVLQNPTDAEATRLLQDVGTSKWQLVRELLVTGYQADWSWRDGELRQLAWALFSSPMCTKSTLESAFNHIRDSGKRQTKSDTMASATRYSYLALQPYARSETGGVNQVVVDAEDFLAVGNDVKGRAAIEALKMFKPIATPMPQSYPHPKDIQAKWRPAGYHANRKAAAAMALVLIHAPSWDRISSAWSGDYG